MIALIAAIAIVLAAVASVGYLFGQSHGFRAGFDDGGVHGHERGWRHGYDEGFRAGRHIGLADSMRSEADERAIPEQDDWPVGLADLRLANEVARRRRGHAPTDA